MLARNLFRFVVYALALAPLLMFSGADVEVRLMPVIKNQRYPRAWIEGGEACWARVFDKVRAARAERVAYTITGIGADGMPHSFSARTRRIGDSPGAASELLSRPPGRDYDETRCAEIPEALAGRPFRVEGEVDFRAHRFWSLTQTVVALDFGGRP